MQLMPGLAILIHELTPYRLHLLRRFRDELPQFHLHIFLTSSAGGFEWQIPRPEGITWHDFSKNAPLARQGQLAEYFHERRKGHRIAAALDQIRPSAVITCCFFDAAHRLVIHHCHRQGIPALLWADSSIPSEQSHGLRRALKHLLLPQLLRKCSAVLPWGTMGREFYLKYGVPERRILLVPAEPDYRVIENPPADAIATARERFALRPDRNRILFVGRLAREKRVDLLIQAFAQIAEARPGWDLLIVGDGPLREPLQAMAPAALRARIIWTGAMTTADALAPFYHLADLFVLPSDREPWGIVVNEAAAAGLPLVCSDIVGAAGDLLRPGSNGQLFPHGDSVALANTLRLLTGSPELSAMGQKSREILAQWRTMADPVRGMRKALAFSRAAQ